MINKKLQVTTKAGDIWGDGKFFAVGDCNFGCVGNHPNWIVPPIPKISYPGEEQALHACKNIEIIDQNTYGNYSMCRPCLYHKQPFVPQAWDHMMPVSSWLPMRRRDLVSW